MTGFSDPIPVYIPLCNPLPLSMTGFTDSQLMNRICRSDGIALLSLSCKRQRWEPLLFFLTWIPCFGESKLPYCEQPFGEAITL